MNGPTIILAGSGPSLDVAAIMGDDEPVAAISTAIRCFERCPPYYWVFVDKPNPQYGHDNGEWALRDPHIAKITIDQHHTLPNMYPSVILHRYNNNEEDVGRTFLDGKPGLLRACHRSILFATQCFAASGWKRIVYAGCDFETTLDRPYAHDGKLRNHNAMLDHNAGHARTVECLRAWQPIARRHGVEFLSASPGPINDFMEPYQWTTATSSRN